MTKVCVLSLQNAYLNIDSWKTTPFVETIQIKQIWSLHSESRIISPVKKQTVCTVYIFERLLYEYRIRSGGWNQHSWTLVYDVMIISNWSNYEAIVWVIHSYMSGAIQFELRVHVSKSIDRTTQLQEIQVTQQSECAMLYDWTLNKINTFVTTC